MRHAWLRLPGWMCAVAMGAVVLPMSSQMSISAATRARGAVTPRASSATVSPASVTEALQAMFADADTIFAGEVTSIERTDGEVLVHLSVHEAVRGVAAGQAITLREWSGLWTDAVPRYLVGQQALFLLRSASVAGFASPVADGVIALHGATAGATADLRWVALHVPAKDAARLAPMRALAAAAGSMDDAGRVQQAEESIRGMAAPSLRPGDPVGIAPLLPLADGASAVDPNEAMDSAIVLDMLHAWQRAAEAS